LPQWIYASVSVIAALVTRGSFSVEGSSLGEVFDKFVGVCGELGAKLDDIDTLEYEVSGKTKTTWKAWGQKFHTRFFKDPTGIH